MNSEFWRGRRVLVTGHTGFKGSWLSLLLNSFGARVAGYALPPPTQPSLYALARVGDVVESTIGDVRDAAALTGVVQSFVPEIILHMAAQSVVLRSYDDPVETYSTNVLGTVHTLEAARRLRRPCTIVNVTTDKCYENRGWPWGYRENDALGGHDPYSNSKACAELVAQAYRDSFFDSSRIAEHGVGLACARAGNVIGGGDWTPRQLVPDAVAALQRAQPVTLRHPGAVRPWQHVLDCLGGYLTLAEAVARDPVRYSGGWNFGPADSETCTVAQIVEALAAYWNVGTPWLQDQVTHAPEAAQLRLDVSKCSSELGWRARWAMADTVHAVANWYRDYFAGVDPRALCDRQIELYLATPDAADVPSRGTRS
jgi:CDP-glucose 4,6-dehydratase